MTRNFGYIPDVIADDHYIQGGHGNLGGVLLRADRCGNNTKKV